MFLCFCIVLLDMHTQIYSCIQSHIDLYGVHGSTFYYSVRPKEIVRSTKCFRKVEFYLKKFELFLMKSSLIFVVTRCQKFEFFPEKMDYF